MDAIHKIVMFCATPLTVGLVLLLAGLVVAVRWQRKGLPVGRLVVALVSVALAWLWLWSTPLMTRMIGLPLERLYPSQLAETMPDADAILLLGGGMGANTNAVPYDDKIGLTWFIIGGNPAKFIKKRELAHEGVGERCRCTVDGDIGVVENWGDSWQLHTVCTLSDFWSLGGHG